MQSKIDNLIARLQTQFETYIDACPAKVSIDRFEREKLRSALHGTLDTFVKTEYTDMMEDISGTQGDLDRVLIELQSLRQDFMDWATSTPAIPPDCRDEVASLAFSIYDKLHQIKSWAAPQQEKLQECQSLIQNGCSSRLEKFFHELFQLELALIGESMKPALIKERAKQIKITLTLPEEPTEPLNEVRMLQELTSLQIAGFRQEITDLKMQIAETIRLQAKARRARSPQQSPA